MQMIAQKGIISKQVESFDDSISSNFKQEFEGLKENIAQGFEHQEEAELLVEEKNMKKKRKEVFKEIKDDLYNLGKDMNTPKETFYA